MRVSGTLSDDFEPKTTSGSKPGPIARRERSPNRRQPLDPTEALASGREIAPAEAR